MHWLTRSPDDAGGAPPAGESDAQNTPPGSDGGSGESGENKSAQTPEQIVESLTKERDEWKGKHEGVAKKLGEQSGQVGTLKKFYKEMEDDPIGLAKAILKKAGKNVTFNEQTPVDLGKALQEGDPASQASAIEKSMGNAAESVRAEIAPALKLINEQVLSGKYKDWDEMHDSRDNVRLAHVSGQVLDQELYYLAARGMKVQEAIDEAKKEAVEEYVKSLQDKNKGHVSGGSSDASKGSAQEAAITLEQVLEKGLL